jgi:predicted nucleotidyltransferase
MESQIQPNLDEIASLCRRYGVRRLAVFGSILRGDFDPLRSDADFLVEFEPGPVAARMQNYLALRTALASLLSRPVDLRGAARSKNHTFCKAFPSKSKYFMQREAKA